jgi:hypothetical protein
MKLRIINKTTGEIHEPKGAWKMVSGPKRVEFYHSATGRVAFAATKKVVDVDVYKDSWKNLVFEVTIEDNEL